MSKWKEKYRKHYSFNLCYILQELYVVLQKKNSHKSLMIPKAEADALFACEDFATLLLENKPLPATGTIYSGSWDRQYSATAINSDTKRKSANILKIQYVGRYNEPDNTNTTFFFSEKSIKALFSFKPKPKFSELQFMGEDQVPETCFTLPKKDALSPNVRLCMLRECYNFRLVIEKEDSKDNQVVFTPILDLSKEEAGTLLCFPSLVLKNLRPGISRKTSEACYSYRLRTDSSDNLEIYKWERSKSRSKNENKIKNAERDLNAKLFFKCKTSSVIKYLEYIEYFDFSLRPFD